MLRSLSIACAFLVVACSDHREGAHEPTAPQIDSPEVRAGERLFLDGRFAQFFAENSGGNLNAPLLVGDPVLETITLGGVQQPSPFAGGTMHCAVCHNVDQVLAIPGGGMRSYADFAVGSPTPLRPDGSTMTVRNTPPLVNASIPREAPGIFHFDGEFATIEKLVSSTITGRNYGWLISERDAAQTHVAAVIRQDDGMGSLASGFGGIPYSTLLDSATTGLPIKYALPSQFTLNMSTATDADIVNAVAELIATFVRSLEFERDSGNRYSGSPYDVFLALNSLPRAPEPGEASLDYARRLRALLGGVTDPEFVDQGPFEFHSQNFVFGPLELHGLRTYLRESPSAPVGGVGNCMACHPPPDFTDFGFHNAGFTQEEYDSVHGFGTFRFISVPDLATRDADPEAYLPASASYPSGHGPFRVRLDPLNATVADLGLWNIFANDSYRSAQSAILTHLDLTYGNGTQTLGEAILLPLTESLFKTPGLRDLGHSEPYGHAGNFTSLDAVVTHYMHFGTFAAQGFVRNGDPRLNTIQLVVADVGPIVAFLRSLNEDFE